MAQTAFNKKEAEKLINEKRASGKTDQEIYFDLKQFFTDHNKLAQQITSTVKEQLRKENSMRNIILCILLGAAACGKFFLLDYINYDLIDAILSFDKMTMYLILPSIFYIILIFLIPKYELNYYRSTLVFVFYDAVRVFSLTKDFPLSLFYYPIIAAVAFLAFDLEIALFPNYSSNGLKKDKNGDFIIPD